jgi:hypothetical protein
MKTTLPNTTIFENIKTRVRWLLENEAQLGVMEVQWAKAICEELERMIERIEKLEKR